MTAKPFSAKDRARMFFSQWQWTRDSQPKALPQLIEHIREAERAAYTAGQERMRERARVLYEFDAEMIVTDLPIEEMP